MRGIWDSRFRSWTTCSTWSGRTTRSARPPARMPRPGSPRSSRSTASPTRGGAPPTAWRAPRTPWMGRDWPGAWRKSRSGASAGPPDIMARRRLDLLMVARGLAPTRERARALILSGDVQVDGRPVTKAGTAIAETANVSLRQPDHPWVGRGGMKLDHALRRFGIEVSGATALDLGASTGGFTDVLLARGAAHVVALDVGHGQLHWRLRTDPRVTAIERVNARFLSPEQLPAEFRRFDVITVDLSFISLRHVLPVLPALLAPGGRVIVLVKPQFEAGRGEVGAGGIVRDGSVHSRVVDEVAAAAHRVGLERVAVEESPVTGAEGNREFLMLLSPAG